MSTHHNNAPQADFGTTAPDPDQPHERRPAGHPIRRGHGLMMLLCCVPMIAIAVVLVATGVAGGGALVGALLCVVMMTVMMFAMPGGHGER